MNEMTRDKLGELSATNRSNNGGGNGTTPFSHHSVRGSISLPVPEDVESYLVSEASEDKTSVTEVLGRLLLEVDYKDWYEKHRGERRNGHTYQDGNRSTKSQGNGRTSDLEPIPVRTYLHVPIPNEKVSGYLNYWASLENVPVANVLHRMVLDIVRDRITAQPKK